MFKDKLKTIPKPGMRIYKTALCVFLCLLLNYLFGVQLALISAWAAIICIQSTLENTLKVGLSRFLGTSIGGIFAMLILPLAQNTQIEWLYIILMPVGIIAVIYSCVLLKMPGSASMGAFVYIGVLFIPFNPNMNNDPYRYAIYRIFDTMVGVAIALLVNRFIVPPKASNMSNVLVNANTYPRIYERIKGKLKDNVELILFASSLAENNNIKNAASDTERFGESPRYDLCVPVPLEFQNQGVLSSVYVGEDYSVTPFELNQQGGYASIPSEYYPATIVWHTEEAQKTLNSYREIIKTKGMELPLDLASHAKGVKRRREKKSKS